MFNFEKLKTSMGELNQEIVFQMIEEVMRDGGTDAGKAMAACQEGMSIVGSLFESGEYYVADLIFAGELMTQAIEMLKPALTQSFGANLGKMILCTVQNDIHDIGKNVVKATLGSGGFNVIDLGVDVAPDAIVKAAQENDIRIIGLSGVLTLAIDSMKATVEAFKAAEMRQGVKIIIGGAPVSEEYCELVGADAWSLNAFEGFRICRDWVEDHMGERR
jgi:dimethylamine corrinoid protein